MEIVKIENLNKQFGEHIIFENFNLSVNEGEMMAIMGPSGCGKSTLLNIIGLIETFEAGEYTLFEKKNVKVNTDESAILIRNHINYLFQNFALIDEDSVEENLMIALRYVKLTKEEKKKKIEEVLEKLNMEKYLKAKINELSGGQQQRIAIARVMLKPCDLILADEPTGSLDEDNKLMIMSLLKELNEQGKTIIIVTHDPEVGNMCQRVINL
ncbi:MAG: putative bacteriocin export ABC transporter [Erysipelotrichaceae bacterium]|nr:putative bacteriocin export ABC transporter [Erysipelotrichaceae bacterium]